MATEIWVNIGSGKWLVAWWHQAITWTSVDSSSVKSSDIQNRAISQEMPQPSITKIFMKITCLKFHSNLPGANELMHIIWFCKWLEMTLLQCKPSHVPGAKLLVLHKWLTHWGRDKMAAISKTTFSNAFLWMKIYEFRLRFQWRLFLRFELTIFQS